MAYAISLLRTPTQEVVCRIYYTLCTLHRTSNVEIKSIKSSRVHRPDVGPIYVPSGAGSYCQLSVLSRHSMIRRTKAKEWAHSTSIHTRRDDQSETDAQSQASEEANDTRQAGRSARVRRDDLECHHALTLLFLLQDGGRFYSRTRFLFPLGILRG
jgi:hypothetical protein